MKAQREIVILSNPLPCAMCGRPSNRLDMGWYTVLCSDICERRYNRLYELLMKGEDK